jgi:hypothetical protein
LATGGVISQLFLKQMSVANNREGMGIAIMALIIGMQLLITSKIVSGWVRDVDKEYPGFRGFYKRKREQEAADNPG